MREQTTTRQLNLQLPRNSSSLEKLHDRVKRLSSTSLDPQGVGAYHALPVQSWQLLAVGCAHRIASDLLEDMFGEIAKRGCIFNFRSNCN